MEERYRIIYKPSSAKKTWDKPLNVFSDQGYEVYKVKDDFILMRLEQPAKYEDVDAVKAVDHSQVEAYVNNGEGWKVDNIYSKHTVLTRHRK